MRARLLGSFSAEAGRAVQAAAPINNLLASARDPSPMRRTRGDNPLLREMLLARARESASSSGRQTVFTATRRCVSLCTAARTTA